MFTPIGSHINENFNFFKKKIKFDIWKCQEVTFVKTIISNFRKKSLVEKESQLWED